ncbi:fibronectin type III domain-containing protein, partial [Eggerthellaceae bacterium 24-137]
TMGLKAGTYYVKVDYSLGGIVGETYTLKADFAASPFWEEEVNDDADAAKAMVIGSAYSGIIDAGGDEDWYKVTLPSAGKFTLSFGHTYKKDYGSWTVGLYAADKSTRLHQASWSNRSTGTDSFTMGLKAGTYYVKVDYSLGGIVGETYTLRWDRALTKASISVSKSSLAYTGKAQKPSLTIKAGGVKLKKGTDYSVGYKNNKKVGIATITIKGKGSYAGVTRTTTFKIVPKGTTISKAAGGKKGFTVKWKKQASQTSGYQIRYSTAKSMKNAKTVTVTSTKKTSCKVTKLKAKKTYYIQVRTYKKVGKATYYSSWSKAKAVKTKK